MTVMNALKLGTSSLALTRVLFKIYKMISYNTCALVAFPVPRCVLGLAGHLAIRAIIRI